MEQELIDVLREYIKLNKADIEHNREAIVAVNGEVPREIVFALGFPEDGLVSVSIQAHFDSGYVQMFVYSPRNTLEYQVWLFRQGHEALLERMTTQPDLSVDTLLSIQEGKFNNEQGPLSFEDDLKANGLIVEN